MTRVEEHIHIDIPVERVFDFIANQPERMPDWWPPISLQERVTPPPTQIGSISKYGYNMMGVEVKGEHKVLAFVPNEHLNVTTISGINSSFDFHFAPENGGTRLTVTVDYSLPGSFLGQLLNKVLIERKNVEDLQTGLKNLKRILEEGK